MFENYHTARTRFETEAIGSPVDYMKSQIKRDDQFFLDRTSHLMQALGDPQNRVPVIHIAGTSGKGSVSTMIHNSLRAAGFRTGLFQSPFVTTSIENIHGPDGLLISPDNFVIYSERVLAVMRAIANDTPELKPSYGELFFAIAMCYLADQDLDYIVVETGCGGRFDYSNACQNIAATVLTPIGLDHTDILGNTIEAIAWHKAGIMKQPAPTFSAAQTPEVMSVFNTQAADHGIDITYITDETNDPLYPFATTMPGAHQQRNAALAAAVVRHIGAANALGATEIDTAISTGVHETRLPARIEIMQDDPLVILDGAHSPQKIAAFFETAPAITKNTKQYYLVALKAGKDAAAILSAFSHADRIYFTSFQLQGFGACDPQELSDTTIANGICSDVIVEADPHDALTHALAAAKADNATLIIIGSLYLAGILRQHWISEDDILSSRTSFPQVFAKKPLIS